MKCYHKTLFQFTLHSIKPLCGESVFEGRKKTAEKTRLLPSISIEIVWNIETAIKRLKLYACVCEREGGTERNTDRKNEWDVSIEIIYETQRRERNLI